MSYATNSRLPAPYPAWAYGAALGLEPNLSEQHATSFSEMGTSEKLLVGGIVIAVLVGVGWLLYKRVQLYEMVAEKEGSAGYMKMAATDTGAHLLTRAFD